MEMRIVKRRVRAENKTPHINIISLFLLWIPSLYAQEPSFKWLEGLGETRYHRVDSRLLEQTYHVFVRLPEEYEPGKKFPAVYLLDGGMTFPILAGYYRYLRLGEEFPAAIVVGISYGTDDWQKGNMRSRDYTAKADDRPYWGGADNFQNILRTEILPLIEQNYSADSSRRIIFGQSLGGQFVLYTAQTAPELFWGYIASNPALHRNLDLFLNMKPAEAKAPDPRRLFVSSGSDDDPEFREPALAWMQQWSKREQLPWSLKTMTLEGQSHFSAAPEAFRQGLRWIFTEEN
jgi:hypothetical protein